MRFAKICILNKFYYHNISRLILPYKWNRAIRNVKDEILLKHMKYESYFSVHGYYWIPKNLIRSHYIYLNDASVHKRKCLFK